MFDPYENMVHNFNFYLGILKLKANFLIMTHWVMNCEKLLWLAIRLAG